MIEKKYVYRAQHYSHTFGWRNIDGWYDDLVDAHWHRRLWTEENPYKRTRIIRIEVVSEPDVVEEDHR